MRSATPPAFRMSRLFGVAFAALFLAVIGKFGHAALFATSSKDVQVVFGSESERPERLQFRENRATIRSANDAEIARSVWTTDEPDNTTTTTTPDSTNASEAANSTTTAVVDEASAHEETSESEKKSDPGDAYWHREYPGGPLYAHIAGYITPYGADAGLEDVLDDSMTDHSRRGSVNESDPPLPEVQLTINDGLQQTAWDALSDANQDGAVVVMGASTGKVYAMVSKPSFDPNDVATNAAECVLDDEVVSCEVSGSTKRGVAVAQLERLVASSDHVLEARAFNFLYPPGSILKPFWLAAALDQGTLDQDFEFPQESVFLPENLGHCPPGDTSCDLSAGEIHNAGGGSCGGTLTDILARSCNIAFVEMVLGNDTVTGIGPDGLQQQVDQMGFNTPLPFTLPAAEPHFPRPAVMADSAIAYNVIGDNDVRVTPLFMASLFSSIAANGDAPNPLLLETDEPSVWLEDVISEDSAAFLRTALQETRNHTASSIGRSHLSFGAKTGTPQGTVGEGRRVAWTVLFSVIPEDELVDDQENVVVVTVIEDTQDKGSKLGGGSDAAPVGIQVLESAVSRLGLRFG